MRFTCPSVLAFICAVGWIEGATITINPYKIGASVSESQFTPDVLLANGVKTYIQCIARCNINAPTCNAVIFDEVAMTCQSGFYNPATPVAGGEITIAHQL